MVSVYIFVIHVHTVDVVTSRSFLSPTLCENRANSPPCSPELCYSSWVRQPSIFYLLQLRYAIMILTPYLSPVLFCGAGVMSYLTFGADVQTVVIVNLDTTSKFTQVVCDCSMLRTYPLTDVRAISRFNSYTRSPSCCQCHSNCSLLCASWRTACSLAAGRLILASSGRRTCSDF